MGNGGSAPAYSISGLLFGQALGARSYTKALTFEPLVSASLQGRQYVVTGGSSGIGRETVQFLYTHGATVHVLCRDEQRGQTTAADIRRLEGGCIRVHRVDCSRPAELQTFAQDIFEATGASCHGLVNNAGALLTRREIVDGLESHVGCHVIGLHALTKFLRPALERAVEKDDSKAVHVVNVASAGLYGVKLNIPALQDGFAGVAQPDGQYDGALVYAVCKRAQLELTQHWAQELASSGILMT